MKVLKSYLLKNDIEWNDLIVESLKLRKNYGDILNNSIFNRFYMLLHHISSLRNINKSYYKNYIAIFL